MQLKDRDSYFNYLWMATNGFQSVPWDFFILTGSIPFLPRTFSCKCNCSLSRRLVTQKGSCRCQADRSVQYFSSSIFQYCLVIQRFYPYPIFIYLFIFLLFNLEQHFICCSDPSSFWRKVDENSLKRGQYIQILT